MIYLYLIVAMLFAPTVDRFVVSSASCTEAYARWDERSPGIDVHEDVYIVFTTWNEQRVYLGEYLNFTNPEWWWTPFSGDGKTWAVSGFALTDIGRVDTFNHIEINCSLKTWIPIVEK